MNLLSNCTAVLRWCETGVFAHSKLDLSVFMIASKQTIQQK